MSVKRSWKLLALMSITVPVILLVTFRLAGILQGPIAVEETLLEPIRRYIERPYYDISIPDGKGRIVAIFNDGGFLMVHEILVWDYEEGSLYGGSDRVSIIMNLTCQIDNGHIEGMHIAIRDSYEESQMLFFVNGRDAIQRHARNAIVVGYRGQAKNISINIVGVNSPRTISFRSPLHWILRSPHNQTHELEIICKTTYYNGTVYKMVVQPFYLKVAPDGNDSFEEAEEVFEGTYLGLCLGGYDRSDFYKIYAVEGERINVSVWATKVGANFPCLILRVYDQEQRLLIERGGRSFFETAEVIANLTGYWFIEVSVYSHHGYYHMEVRK